MLVQTRGLGVTAGPVVVFDDLDLSVNAGECLVVTGANGAGKSTLLRCLYGGQTPTSGTVSVCGRVPDERSATHRRQVSAVLDELTLRQHLDLLGRSFGGPCAVPASLASRADVPAGELSAGQRRRLLLHTAVARPHSVLLLDEPERALDSAGRAGLAELVSASLVSGAAVVVASHDAGLVEAVADYVVEL